MASNVSETNFSNEYSLLASLSDQQPLPTPPTFLSVLDLQKLMLQSAEAIDASRRMDAAVEAAREACYAKMMDAALHKYNGCSYCVDPQANVDRNVLAQRLAVILREGHMQVDIESDTMTLLITWPSPMGLETVTHRSTVVQNLNKKDVGFVPVTPLPDLLDLEGLAKPTTLPLQPLQGQKFVMPTLSPFVANSQTYGVTGPTTTLSPNNGVAGSAPSYRLGGPYGIIGKR